jgi:peptide/nickel transport system substrate-binding protein
MGENHGMADVSRRRFLGFSAASVVGGLVLGRSSGATALSGAETSPVFGQWASKWATAASEGGSLSVGMGSVVDGLTPFAIQGYVWSQMLGFVFYDPLIKKDAAGNLVPCIATEWDTTDPTKTILKIRDGVTFHDGTPLTAADVAYSIAARADEALIASTAGRPIMTPSQWVSAEAVDDFTVEVNTTERVEFLVNPQPVLIVPNESFGNVNFANEVLGTGPFTLGNFQSGTGVDAVANPDYWDGKPPLDNLSFAFFADPATASTGLRSGQVDALYDVAPINVDAVSDVDGTTLVEAATYAFWWIIQMGKEPLDNPEVRRALRYCFDVETMNNVSFRGRGVHTWNPFTLYPDNTGPEAEDINYDPDRARELLAAAGAEGISVPILCIAGYEDGIAAAQVLQQGFQAAGVDCEVEVAEAADWLDRTYTTGTWEGITFNAGNLPFPSKNFFDYLVNPSSILSAFTEGDVVPETAELYRTINATPFDSSEIEALLLQAQEQIVDDAIVYFGFGAPVSLVLPETLTGVVSNGFGDVEWHKASFA